MKKTIRLTEADLARIIKRVIKENKNDNAKEIIEACAKEVLTLDDMAKIPTCLDLAMETFISKKIPTDFMKGFNCATELTNLRKTAQDGINFMNCVLEKINTPTPDILNTNESRKRR